MPPSLAHIALIARDYDEAIAWFRNKLGFTLVEGQYQPEQDKRWVLVAPPGGGENAATLLLARASNPGAIGLHRQPGRRAARCSPSPRVGCAPHSCSSPPTISITTTRPTAPAASASCASRRRRPTTRSPVFEDLYGNLWDPVQLA